MDSKNDMFKKDKTLKQIIQSDKAKEVWRILNFIKNYYQDHLREKRVAAYKNYFMYKIDRQLKIKDFQTNLKSPVTKMYVDAMWTWVYDNIINFRVIGRDRDDQKKAEKVKAFLERWFSVSNSREEFMTTLKEALICWPWYIKVGYVDREKNIKYRKDFKDVKHTIKEQFPYIKYASIFNIFHDPTVERFEDSPYVIERKVLNKDSVKKYYTSLVKDIDKKMDEAIAQPMYFSNYDYNKIKHTLFWNKDYITRYIVDNNMDMDTFTRNYLSIDYQGNYIEVIEFWTNDELIILFNWREAYAGPTNLPINKKPYASIQYNKAPGLAFWNGLWTSVADIQSMVDELLNLQMDNTKFQIAPMYQKIKGSDMFSANSKKWLEYTPFWMVEVNTPDGIKRLELGSPEFTGTNMIQFLLQLWEMSEWVNSYTMGYQNKVERSATWVSALVQAFKARLLPLVESMNQALATIAEMRIAIAVTLMKWDFTVRVLWEDGSAIFKEVTLDDLLGKYDIEFDAQALKSATREVKRSQLAELLPIAMQAGINANTWEYFIDMKKLWRSIFEAYELPQDLVMESKDIVKEKTNFQFQQQVASQKAQERIAAMQQAWAGFQQQQAQWKWQQEDWQYPITGERPPLTVQPWQGWYTPTGEWSWPNWWDTRSPEIRANTWSIWQEVPKLETGSEMAWILQKTFSY